MSWNRMHRWVVGHNDRTGRRRWFARYYQAIAYIGRIKDRASVERGDYYLDGPCTGRH